MNTNCEEAVLQPSGPMPVESLESYQALKDAVELHGLNPETALDYLARIYHNEAVRMSRVFSTTETGPLTFHYDRRMRELEAWARKLKGARDLYFSQRIAGPPPAVVHAIVRPGHLPA